MALEIIRTAAEVPGFVIEQCSLDGREISLERAMLPGRDNSNQSAGLGKILQRAAKSVLKLVY